MGYKIHYCPICGMSEQLCSNKICDWCGNEIQMVESMHDFKYYTEKAQQVYSKKYNFDVTEEEEHSILLEEARNNPLFDEELAKKMFNKWKKQSEKAADIWEENYYKKKEEKNVPKCPTCGSTNIKKLSTASKVMGAATFGLFSKTAKSQFKCSNCGYKW